MRRQLLAILAVVLCVSGALALPVHAQDKSSSPEAKPIVLLRVLVVFEEYDGQNKISSLPYQFYVRTNDPTHRRASLRSGVRVPISTGGEAKSIQYYDVGANIDCSANTLEPGLFSLELDLQRSWLFMDSKSANGVSGALSGAGGDPVVQQFNMGYTLSLRDGQTIEASSAANPVTGHVLKVLITMNVMK